MPAGGAFEDKVEIYLRGLSPEAREMILRRTARRGSVAPAPQPEAVPAAVAAPAPQPVPAGLAPTPAPLHVTVPLDPPAPTRTVMFEARSAVFEPFQPFVVGERLPTRQRGWIEAATFSGLWTFLVREGLPTETAPWDAPREVTVAEAKRLRDEAMPKLRNTLFTALRRTDAAARRDPRIEQKFAARIGGDRALADLRDMLDLLPRIAGIEKLLAHLPAQIAANEAAEKPAGAMINAHVQAAPDEAVYVATAVAGRLATPATLVRFASQYVGSTDVATLRRSAAASAMVDVALSAAERHVVRFVATLAARGPLVRLLHDIRQFHEIVRGATTAVDIEDDRQWSHRLAALRTAMSEPLVAAVDGVVPALRVAMLGDRFAHPSDADRDDALRAAALLAAARRHRDSLAVNAAVTRLWPVVDQALQVYGRPLIDKLRTAKGPDRERLELASGVFVDIAEHVHGDEYAGVLRKTREKALRGQ
jgi:hypothetical protein